MSNPVMFSVILYPDSIAYDFDEQLLSAIQFVVSRGGEYAYITHDKDICTPDDLSGDYSSLWSSYKLGELKKLHVHFICRFKNAISFHAFCDGIKLKGSRSCVIELHSFEASVRYLVHADNSNKVLYSIDSITSNFVLDKYFKDINKTAKIDESTAIRDILSFMSCHNLRSFDDVMFFALDNGYYSYFRRSYAILHEFFYHSQARKGAL